MRIKKGTESLEQSRLLTAAIEDGDIKALSALPDAGRQPGFGSWGSAYACG